MNLISQQSPMQRIQLARTHPMQKWKQFPKYIYAVYLTYCIDCYRRQVYIVHKYWNIDTSI